MSVEIDTLSVPCGVTNSTNVSTNGFTEPVPTATAPSGDGVIPLGHGGGVAAAGVKLTFFGVGSDTNTFLANVYGWEFVAPASTARVGLWVPVLLGSFSTITLDSGHPGIAGTLVGSTQYFASDITLVTGNSGISVEVVSPGHAANQIAHVVLNPKGARFLEVRFSTGGSATSCNAIWKRL